MNKLVRKYRDRLDVLKKNRAETFDTNTDHQNEMYDTLIRENAEMCRDLESEFDETELDFLLDALNLMYHSSAERLQRPFELGDIEMKQLELAKIKSKALIKKIQEVYGI